MSAKSFFDKFPNLVHLWDHDMNCGKTAFDKIGTRKKVHLKCENGHCTSKRMDQIKDGFECKMCKNLNVSIFYTHPEIAEEWDYSLNTNKTPDMFTAGSNKFAFWVCKKNPSHKWRATILNRTFSKSNCPCCANQKACKENCLLFKSPDVSKEWDYDKNTNRPENVVWKSQKKAWWKCSKGHEWQSSILSRTRGDNCPYCANQKVCSDNCLAVTHPHLLKEWDYNRNHASPFMVIAGSDKKIWWKCKKNHSWLASLSSRSRKMGTGCPFCKKVIVKDGTACDSMLDAFFYIKYKYVDNIDFIYNKRYTASQKYRFDFFILKTNTYVEVTSFTKDDKLGVAGYIKYLRRIAAKKKIAKSIGANFLFIQKQLTIPEFVFVRENLLKD